MVNYRYGDEVVLPLCYDERVCDPAGVQRYCSYWTRRRAGDVLWQTLLPTGLWDFVLSCRHAGLISM